MSVWPEFLPFSDAFWAALNWTEDGYDRGLHKTFDELETEEEGKMLFQIVDYLGAMSSDDPLSSPRAPWATNPRAKFLLPKTKRTLKVGSSTIRATVLPSTICATP